METDEVIVRKLGDAVIMVPKDRLWDTFLEGLSDFTDDFFAEGRTQDDRDQQKKLSRNIFPLNFFVAII